MRTGRNTESVCLFLAACGLAFSSAGLAACVVSGDAVPAGGGDDEAVGSAVAAITTVPAGVQCIQLVLTGSTSNTVDAGVTPGTSSASISLGALPAGALTVTASAYNVACASVTSSTAASWIGAPTTVTITPGLTTQISLTLVESVPVNASVSFVPKVQSIATGFYSSYAVLADGTVRSWGYNGNGALGDGTYQNHSKPVAVSGLANVVSVTGGNGHACALRNDGTAACWGANGNGQLGNGTTTSSTTPVGVSYAFTQLAAGDSHTCGITPQSTVLCWGANGNGQLGNGTTTGSTTPTTTSFPTAPALLTAGYQDTLAYYGNYGYGAGSNSQGQFGIGTTQATDSSPLSLGLDGNGQRYISAVGASAGGGFACALTDLGAVYCSGINGYGQLGNGTTTSSTSPVQVVGLSNITSIATQSNGACALAADRTVWCWGYNWNGTLGNGTGTSSSTPVQVLGLSSVTSIASGYSHVCALRSDGTVWCWGYNGYGQLGDGTTTQRAIPVQVQF